MRNSGQFGTVGANVVGGSFHEHTSSGSILAEHKRTKSKVDRVFGGVSTIVNQDVLKMVKALKGPQEGRLRDLQKERIQQNRSPLHQYSSSKTVAHTSPAGKS